MNDIVAIILIWVASVAALLAGPGYHPCDRLPELDDRYADGHEDADERAVCERIVAAARAHDLPVPLAMALVHHESRYSEADREGTIRGPWQVHTGYYCPGGEPEGCDLYEAGARALRSALDDARGDHEAAVCEWLVGSAGCETEHDRAWTRSVLAMSREVGR